MRAVFVTAICAGVALPIAALPPWSGLSGRYERAAAQARQGDLEGVLALGRDRVRRHPNDAQARLELGEALLRANDGVAAERTFRAALERGADPWGATLGLGRALQIQRRWQDVLTLLPDSGPTPELTALLLLERGIAELGFGLRTEAASVADQAMRVAADQSASWLLAAKVALAQGDGPTASARIDTALALQPNDVDALLLAASLAPPPADASALDLLDRAVQMAPWRSSARLARARLLMEAGEDEQALKDVAFVVAHAPQNGNAACLRAVLLARLGRYQEASNLFLGMGRFLSQFRRGLYHHAKAEAALGRTETALDLAARYHEAAPNDADGISLLAQCDLAIGRPDIALTLLERIIAAGQTVQPRAGADTANGCRAFMQADSRTDIALSTELGFGIFDDFADGSSP